VVGAEMHVKVIIKIIPMEMQNARGEVAVERI